MSATPPEVHRTRLARFEPRVWRLVGWAVVIPSAGAIVRALGLA